MDEILHHVESKRETIVCGCLQGNYLSKVCQMVKDLVHPQYGVENGTKVGYHHETEVQPLEHTEWG